VQTLNNQLRSKGIEAVIHIALDLEAKLNEAEFDKNLSNQHLETQIEFNQDCKEKLAEYERLHQELNIVLHPNGDAPLAPSLCDLVSYARVDMLKLRNLMESIQPSIEITTCQWKFNDSDNMYLGEVWNTGCGRTFQFMDGDIQENNFSTCPYCSGKIDEWRPDLDEEEKKL
jgi:hypothetical protein